MNYFPNILETVGNTLGEKNFSRKKAAKIITVSQNTKEDVVKTLGIDSEKIIVVHHANFLDVNFMQAVPVPLRYILHVGGRKRWKNFDFLIRALAPVLNQGRRIISDMRRGGMFDESERMLFKELLHSYESGADGRKRLRTCIPVSSCGSFLFRHLCTRDSEFRLWKRLRTDAPS